MSRLNYSLFFSGLTEREKRRHRLYPKTSQVLKFSFSLRKIESVVGLPLTLYNFIRSVFRSKIRAQTVVKIQCVHVENGLKLL